MDALRAWVDASGEWAPLARPYIGTTALSVKVGAYGREVELRRASSWFGPEASPDDCAGAVRHVRHAVGKVGARVKATPAHTGLAMLSAIHLASGHVYEPMTGDVQTALRSTSGQGRFELFPRAAKRGRTLVKVDARFQYAALCSASELPVGDPDEVRGEPDEFARGWVEVEFAVPRDGPPIGLLGVYEGGHWSYPTTGKHRTWCALAEVQLARRHGYKVRTLRGYVWRHKARALARWSNHLTRERERVSGLSVPTGERDAARAALRSILVQTVGMMHGRDARSTGTVDTPQEIPDDASAIRRLSDGRWTFETSRPALNRIADSHPEWTVQLYALARVRLATQLLRQPATKLVGCALDAYYVAGEPALDDDDGRTGRFRTAGRYPSFPAMATLRDLYTATKAEVD